MPIFVIFIFASVVFGAGLLLSPALPTHQPRIGLAATLALGVVTWTAVSYTAAFRWDTLIIDYVWFGLLVGVFLTGTFSMGMFKAEAEGRRETGWPGPRELAMFLTIAIILAGPALIFPVPLDTDAQGFGYLALTLRDGGSLTTLAPFHPEISYLYSPGFLALTAYLAHALNAGIQNVQLALGAVLAFLFVWLSYDFGNEVADDGTRRSGIAFAITSLIGTGLLLADLDSHYTTLLALVFALAFLTFTLRWSRAGHLVDFLAAALMLAAVPLAHPDTTIILILGYVPWLAFIWLSRERPTLLRWLGMAVGIPGLGLLLTAPWLAKIAPLLGSAIQSPFEIDARHLVVMVVYHGGLIVGLAAIGVALGVRKRRAVDLLMIPWLVLIVDFSSLGILKALAPGLLAPILKYDYPFSIAWHGPIIPYMALGGTALLWIVDRIGRERADRWLIRASLPFMTAVAAIVVLVVGSSGSLVAFSKQTPLRIFGAFSSAADVSALEWLRLNAPQKALILNHPGPQEGDWVPVIAQRDAVYFRPQPFFQGTEASDQRQQALRAFWNDPGAPGTAALLRQYGVTYVVVPQIIGDPSRTPEMLRWRPPSPEAILRLDLSRVNYLRLAHEVDGARIYEVLP